MTKEQRKKATMVLSMVWKGQILTPQFFLESMAKQVGIEVPPDAVSVWEEVHQRKMSVNDALVELEDAMAWSP